MVFFGHLKEAAGVKDSREGQQISNVHRIAALDLDAVLSGQFSLHNTLDSNKGQATSKEAIHQTVFSEWKGMIGTTHGLQTMGELQGTKIDGREDLDSDALSIIQWYVMAL